MKKALIIAQILELVVENVPKEITLENIARMSSSNYYQKSKGINFSTDKAVLPKMNTNTLS